jgi:hypothetical protein
MDRPDSSRILLIPAEVLVPAEHSGTKRDSAMALPGSLSFCRKPARIAATYVPSPSEGRMTQAVCWIVVAAVAAYVLYALNRRHRWMVENGFAEEAKASGGGPFLALREFIEPSAAAVQHVREEQQHRAEKEAPGENPDAEDSRAR